MPLFQDTSFLFKYKCIKISLKHITLHFADVWTCTASTGVTIAGITYTVCPTRYRTWQAGRPLLHVATIRHTIDTHYRHIPFHFSHNERTPVQISLQYLHWC